MTLEQMKKYENLIFDFVETYEDMLLNTCKFLLKIFYIFTDIWQYIFYDLITETLSKTSKFFRYATYPLHLIYLKIMFRNKSKENLSDIPIFELGGHYFYGKPGSGKSTSVYHAIMEYGREYGKAAYTTEMMETVRKDIYGKEFYYHQLFEPTDFYRDGKQICGFDNNFNMIVYEEMLSKYHQRNNGTKEFKDEVLPMIASMGTQRHQGIDLFYFISQLPKNDISLMQMLKGYHIPKIKKKFAYKYWLDTGRIRFEIKGWSFISYDIEIGGNNDYQLVNKRRWFYECTLQEDMEFFNRLNMKDKYAKLEKYKGREMIA